MGGSAVVDTADSRLATWTLDAGTIRSWAATAKAGDTLHYAQEYHLSPRSEGAKLVRLLIDQGFATAYQTRQCGGIKRYVVKRLKAGQGFKLEADRRRRPAVMDTEMRAILRVLRSRARFKMLCPANRDLARVVGIAPLRASYKFRKLVQGGWITSRVVDRVKGTRVVTIIADGIGTLDPANG